MLVIDQHLNQRKRIMLLAVSMIIVAAVMFLIIPAVSAANDLNDQLMGIVKELEFNLRDEAADILLGKADLWMRSSLVSAVMTAVTSTAASLFIVFVFIELINEVSKGEATVEVYLRLFIKVAVTLMIMLNLNEILTYVHTLMSYVITEIHKAVEDVVGQTHAQYMKQIAEQIPQLKEKLDSDNNTLFLFGFGIKMFRIWFAGLLSSIIRWIIIALIWIRAWSLTIEICVRKMMMPLAILGTMEGGVRSPGIRYLKKYVACYIRVVIYIVSYSIADYISVIYLEQNVTNLITSVDSDAMFGSVLGAAFMTVIVTIAASSFAKKGATLADEVMGV